MTKIPNFENSRWRTAAILKMFFFARTRIITYFYQIVKKYDDKCI